jgi:predicted ATPase
MSNVEIKPNWKCHIHHREALFPFSTFGFHWSLVIGHSPFKRMPDAHVTSVDAIEAFRVALINYMSKARPAIDDAIDDVGRTRDWLQHDQLRFWEAELKRRRRAVEEAEQAVFSARIASLREVSTAENAAVVRARRAMAEAEEKLRAVKKWLRDFDNRVEPLVKQLEQVQTMLGNTTPRAVAHLATIVKALDAYANVSTSTVVAPPPSTEAAAPQPGTEAGEVKSETE